MMLLSRIGYDFLCLYFLNVRKICRHCSLAQVGSTAIHYFVWGLRIFVWIFFRAIFPFLCLKLLIGYLGNFMTF